MMIYTKRVILLLVAVLSSTIVSLAPLTPQAAYAAVDDPADQLERWLYYRGMRACFESPDFDRTIPANDNADRSSSDLNDGKLEIGDRKEGFGYVGPSLDDADDNDGTVNCGTDSLWVNGAKIFGFPDVVHLICAMNNALSDLGDGGRIEPSHPTTCVESDKFEFDGGGGSIFQRALTKALENGSDYGGDNDRPAFDLSGNDGPDYDAKALYYLLGKRSLEVFCGNDASIETASEDNDGFDGDDDIVSVHIVNSDGTIKRSQSYPLANSDRDESSTVDDVYWKVGGNENEADDVTCAKMAQWTRDSGNAEAYASYIRLHPDAYDQGNTDGGGSTEPVCSAGALGWIICPAMSLMADATEWMASTLQGYLNFNPFAGANNDIKTIWSNILNISNGILAIAFLVVVFSQSTSLGLSSYGIKRMLPRIIAAAILMNLSYYICQILVDLSNIAGIGVTDFISSAAGGTFADNIEQVGTLSKVLVGAGIIAIMAFFFLIPVLLSFLAIFLTIAARNALIVLLVITAPLAFAAWIFPNTEKYFKKWWELLVNLLLLFPLTMLVFASSVVAANVISSATPPDATGGQELQGIIALLVLALPLFAMPFLFKVTGTVISRINAMTQQQLNRGANSAPAKWAGNRAKTYGKFGALGAGAMAAKGLKRASGDRMFNPDKPSRITRGYRRARAYDKAIETNLEARKRGKEELLQERAARVGLESESKKGLLYSVGGPRYSEISAAQANKALSDRAANIRAKYERDDTDRAVVGEHLAKAMADSASGREGVEAEAMAAALHLAKAGGAGGRKILRDKLEAAENVSPEVQKVIDLTLQRDAYGDLIGKRGDAVKGKWGKTGTPDEGRYIMPDGVAPLGTAQLATQDYQTLRDNFSTISVQEAQAILSNPTLVPSDKYAKAVLQARANGETAMPGKMALSDDHPLVTAQEDGRDVPPAYLQPSAPTQGQPEPERRVVNESITNVVPPQSTMNVTDAYGGNLTAFDATSLRSLINNTAGGVQRLSNRDIERISQRVQQETAPEFQQLQTELNTERLARQARDTQRQSQDAAYDTYRDNINPPPPNP